MSGPIAVLAGTPVDTRMGVDCLADRGLQGMAFPLSAEPRAQTAFQHAPQAARQQKKAAARTFAAAPGKSYQIEIALATSIISRSMVLCIESATLTS